MEMNMDHLNVEYEVHLQILLAVGLAVLCFCLAIGCIVCWWHRKVPPSKDKEAGLSLTAIPTDHVTVTLSPSPSINILPIKQQYEALDGEVMDHPSRNSSSSPADDAQSSPSLSPHTVTEPKAPPKSHFTLRRLSSPTISSRTTKPAICVRSSLLSIPKFSLVSKSRRALKAKGIWSDDVICSESSRLTSCHSPAGVHGTFSQTHYSSRYRRGSSSLKPIPSIHFTLFFSPAESRLTVTVLGVYRGSKKMSGIAVKVCLPPVCPTAVRGHSTRRPETPAQVFILQVRSEELCVCTLTLSISCRDFSGLRETPVGELQLTCAEIHWPPGSTVTFTRPLNPADGRMRKSHISQDSLENISASVCSAQLLILLQYQTLAHRIKVMIRKAENLPKLTRLPGTPDHYVIINLRQSGKVISSKETKGASGVNAVWNAPFLFDLPAGDISNLPLHLEFIVIQGRLYMKSCILGRVLIGSQGPEAGKQHWRETCSRTQVETTRWHTLQTDSPVM